MKCPKELTFDSVTRNIFLMGVTSFYNERDNRVKSFMSYLQDFTGNYDIIIVDLDSDERYQTSGDFVVDGDTLEINTK